MGADEKWVLEEKEWAPSNYEQEERRHASCHTAATIIIRDFLSYLHILRTKMQCLTFQCRTLYQDAREASSGRREEGDQREGGMIKRRQGLTEGGRGIECEGHRRTMPKER